MKIAIDAGHGGTDPGAVGVGGRQEKRDALAMAKALKTEMQRRGHQVIMTRSTDTLPSYADRYNKANAENADVFVSMHRNSAGSSAHGAEVLYRTESVKSAADNAKSKALAETLDKKIVDSTGFRDRGAKAQNKRTVVLQKTKMPAVTVEAGFVSHDPVPDEKTGKVPESDNARFDRTMPAMITAIADGLEEHFGKGSASASKPSASKPSVSTPSKPPTAVPVPAFFINGGVVKRGSKGAEVRWVQERLNAHHADAGKVDGVCGTQTERAILRFQTARQSEGRDIGAKAPDGKVGRKTAAILAE